MLDIIAEMHDVKSGKRRLAWMISHHANFRLWNNNDDISLTKMSEYENIYFLELKDLSNPKFLEWLQEKDEKWKEYRGYKFAPHSIHPGIPQINKTDNYFWTNMDLFWKEYTEGKIAKGVSLNSPFFIILGNLF